MNRLSRQRSGPMMKGIASLLLLVPTLAIGQGGQPSITSVVFKPSSVPGGQPAAATVTISDVAPNSGVQVLLSLSSNSAQLGASSVTIASGQRSATVQIRTTPTTTSEVATLKASLGGVVKTASLTITPPLSIRIEFPSSVKTGETVLLGTQANLPAPEGGLVVQYTSAGFRLFEGSSTTATDVIPAGQTATSKKLSIPRTNRDITFTISATANGVTTSRSATIVGPHLSALSASPFQVRMGGELVLTASLVEDAPAGGVILALSATGLPDGMQIPTSMTVPAGARSGHGRIVVTGRLTAPAAAVFKVRLGEEERTVQVPLIP